VLSVFLVLFLLLVLRLAAEKEYGKTKEKDPKSATARVRH